MTAILVACALAGWFYFDRDTRLASHLLTAIDAVGSGVIEIDHQGVIIGANANMETLTGWTARELRGRPITTIMPEKTRVSHPASFAYRTLTVVTHCKVVRKDGAMVPVTVIARIGGGTYIAVLDRADVVIDTKD